ncbi:MAG: HAD family phosphatase [Sedimentisphaerales bacterium]|jgi:beta-phosphoglucomutase family hydrolase|nr:HAD family phosphatase [Sedimentisphaerales bacterium]
MAEDRPKGGVIFDLDGVIAYTGWAHKQAWRELAAMYGVPFDEQLFVRTFGMQNYQIIPLLLGRQVDPTEIQRLSAWKEDRYRQIVASQLRAPAGLVELLHDLRANGLRLAIGSSAPVENVDLVLGRLGITGLFQAIVHGGMVARGKPAPDTFLLAASLLALQPQMCVVVEDAVAGIEAAKAAGMAVVAITTTRPCADLAGADMIIDGFLGLKASDFVRLIECRKRMTA